ncbi:MAG TPA: sensor histidine kinase [Actinomycetota bacterium]
MIDRRRSIAAWTICGLSLALMTASPGIKIAFGMLLGTDDTFLIVPGLMGVTAFAVVGAVIASRTGNPVGWVFLGIAGFASISLPAQNWVDAAQEGSRDLPLLGIADWLSQWPFFLALSLLIAVFFLYPDGRLPSERWRIPWWVFAGSLVFTVVGFALLPSRKEVAGVELTNPVGVDALEPVLGPALAVAAVALVASAFVALASLVVRARGADADTRQQIRWIRAVGVLGGVLFLTLLTLGFVFGVDEAGFGTAVANVLMVLLVVTLVVGIPAATAVAIFRYRLYDLNLVVRKTLVVAVMAAAITTVYVAIVVAVPALIRGVGEGDGIDPLPLVAAAVVAVAFDPLRRAARRLADRLVYGERASPYEVLTAFGERVGETYSTDDVLPRMVQVLAQGTGASSASVWLRVGGQLRREAAWPDEAPGPRSLSITGDALPASPDEHGIEVRHQGELLGALSVTMPPSEPFDPAKEALVRDLAAQAGLLLRNVALIEDLRASRQRLVAAQDEERRKLERNIHDGVQQQLVALAVQLKLASTMIDRDPVKAGSMLDSLQEAAGDALEELRDLARGIYPPLLADKGLAAALESQARKAAVPTTVESDDIGRYPRDVESAVYFCTLEALNNVAKYAEASHADVRLAQTNGHLTFTVHDDGRGFDRDATSFGTGLQGMIDRLDAVGGTCT